MLRGWRHRQWGLVSLTAVLCACQSGGDDPPPARASNSAPLIAGTPSRTVAVGTTYSFSPAAGDGDGDSLTFGIDGKPPWASFDTRTGQLAGKPGLADAGVYHDIVVWVSDGAARAALAPFDLTVTSPSATNRAPQIGGTADASVAAGAAYSFTPVASDPDGTPLTFTVQNRPLWASFDAATGKLYGVPPNAGTFNGIEIAASDGEATVSLPAFNIVVTAPPINRPPIISGPALISVEGGRLYDFTPTASDADGDALTFIVQNRPAWASFDTHSGRLFGTPAATAGSFANIVITVDDGKSSASLPPFTIDVTAPTANRAPVIGGTPATGALQGTQYSFQPAASDADHDALTFAIANRPSWAGFDESTGLLQGTPAAAHIQTYGNIVISVSDGKSSVSLPAFSITVTSSNTSPTISGTPAIIVQVGSSFSFMPIASDADAGTTLTFSIANRPSWAQFSGTTGALTGTPAAADAGIHANIVISVSDGQDSATLPAFAITVNRPPVISGVPPTAATVGSFYSFAPTASDADGDPLTFVAVNVPAWATLSASGVLSGTPALGDVRTFANIAIAVTDGKSVPVLLLPAFAIQVSTPNQPPAIFGTPPTTATVGSQYSFTPMANDPDVGDTLTFSIVNRPIWATLDTHTGTLQGMPTITDVGTTTGIVLAVGDQDGASAALAAFSIVVQSNATRSALLLWLPPMQNTDGSPLTDLAGYKVYWGTSQGPYPNSITLSQSGLASYRVENLSPNTYYFVITAFNSSGVESGFSNVTSITLP